MSTPALPGLFGTVEPILNHYGYLAVALFVAVEDFGIPVPGETILIAAALFAGAGPLNVFVVFVVATLAAIFGDNIGFAIGHFGGRALALRFGKYVFLTEERLDKAQEFFERHGGKIIVVARFIEGLRQANGIVAGISGMHWRRFVVFNAIGAALWVGLWVSLGYLAGNHITALYNQITRYSLYVLIALAVAVAAFIGWRLWRRRARRQARAAEAGPKAEARPHAQAGPKAEARPHAEAGPQAQAGPEAHAGPQAQAGPEAHAGPQAQAGPEAEARREAGAGPESYSGAAGQAAPPVSGAAPGHAETHGGSDTAGSSEDRETAEAVDAAAERDRRDG